MIRVYDRNSLLKYIIANCTRPAIVRSIQDNGAECLGGFSTIPPSGLSGWIIRTKSKYNRTWIVATVVYKDRPRYGIRILDKVPWRCYQGGPDDLYGGDKPSLYGSLGLLLKKRGKNV